MVEPLIQALITTLSWPTIGLLATGVLVGTVLGVIPGLGGIVGLALLMPLTFDMNPFEAFALLLGMFAIVVTGDSIPAILLNIPGTAGSQATIMDGYPLAQKGQAARAFGAAFMSSGLGGLIGALFLALAIPFLRPLVLLLGAPEFLPYPCSVWVWSVR